MGELLKCLGKSSSGWSVNKMRAMDDCVEGIKDKNSIDINSKLINLKVHESRHVVNLNIYFLKNY